MEKKLQSYVKTNRQYKLQFNQSKEKTKFYLDCINLLQLIVQDKINPVVWQYLQMEERPANFSYTSFSSQMYVIKAYHNFLAHYTLLKQGVVLASYNPLRNIYEHILFLYLNLTNPKLGELNFLWGLYELCNEGESKTKLYAELKRLSKNHSHFNAGKSLSSHFIEQQLYSEARLRGDIRKFYRDISNLVHPSILSLTACISFRSNSFEDTLTAGMALTYNLFIILYELYNNELKSSHKKKMLKLLNNYPHFLPEGLFDLIPNKNNSSLNIKEDSDLIMALQ